MMRKTSLALGMALVAGAAGLAWAGGGGKISWGADYDAARESATKSEKLLMIYFTADW